jgi:hypothetical protein
MAGNWVLACPDPQVWKLLEEICAPPDDDPAEQPDRSLARPPALSEELL